MKKISAILLIGAMGLMLTACGTKKEEADSGAQEIESIAIDEDGVGMMNPWLDSDQAGVLEATGFEPVPPAEAVNVTYSYMPSTGMAQMDYNMENARWIYRMQPSDTFEDISGMYYEWDYEGEAKVYGMDAMEYSYVSESDSDLIDDADCTRVINWFDDVKKVVYSLVVSGTDLNGMDTVVYAENLFLAMAPESDGVGPIGEGEAFDSDYYKSFLGTHVSTYDGSEDGFDD